MSDEQLLERITVDPDVMVGKPVVRGTRLTVEHVLGLMAHGASIDEILDEYHSLARDDVRACILFAARSLQSLSFMPLAVESP